MNKNEENITASLYEIGIAFNMNSESLESFADELFRISEERKCSFGEVAEFASAFAKQGLSQIETVARTEDALILAYLTGRTFEDSVKVLTSAVNSFETNTTSVIDKLANVDKKFEVTAKDLAESFARCGQSAEECGISFEQLIALTTAIQSKTARGGALIGNSLKTIFTRLKSKRQELAELLGGAYQLGIIECLIEDFLSGDSVYVECLKTANMSSEDAKAENKRQNMSEEPEKYTDILEKETDKQSFLNRQKEFSKASDKELFERTFVRLCRENEPLVDDELDTYLNYCTSAVRLSRMRREETELIDLKNTLVANGDTVSMALVETIGNTRSSIDFASSKLEKTLKDISAATKHRNRNHGDLTINVTEEFKSQLETSKRGIEELQKLEDKFSSLLNSQLDRVQKLQNDRTAISVAESDYLSVLANNHQSYHKQKNKISQDCNGRMMDMAREQGK